MVKVIASPDCGNSPKKLFLQQFNIAQAEVDIDRVAASVRDDITWDIVGNTRIEGKAAYIEAVEQMKSQAKDELIIHAIITHGKEGAVRGEFRMSSGATVAFCDVYTFGGAKGDSLASIVSYLIDISEESAPA